jgi:hypothetical protein
VSTGDTSFAHQENAFRSWQRNCWHGVSSVALVPQPGLRTGHDKLFRFSAGSLFAAWARHFSVYFAGAVYTTRRQQKRAGSILGISGWRKSVGVARDFCAFDGHESGARFLAGERSTRHDRKASQVGNENLVGFLSLVGEVFACATPLISHWIAARSE